MKENPLKMTQPPRKKLSALPSERPLVSIIMFCRNRVESIRRAVESILQQSYDHWELVIQDGASTDGTREAIESYLTDPRIKLVSEKDSGPFDAMWRCYRRASGEIFGSCLSDEELLPRTLQDGVDYLLFNPNAAALVRDVIYTDLQGKPLKRVNGDEFNFLDYLAMQFSLALCSMLFRREAFLNLNYLDRNWRTNCADFELLARLGEEHQIDYYPGIVAKYAQLHADQLSTNPEYSFAGAQGQLQFIDDFFQEGPPAKPFRNLRPFPLIVTANKLRKIYAKVPDPTFLPRFEQFMTRFDLHYGASQIELARQASGIGALELAKDLVEGIPETSAEYAEARELRESILHGLRLDRPPRTAGSDLPSDSNLDRLEVDSRVNRRLSDQVTMASWADGDLLTNEMLTSWAKILQCVPQALLVLCHEGLQYSDTRRILRNFFSSQGVPRETLLLMPRPSNLISASLICQTDLYLDTFPMSDEAGVDLARQNRIPVLHRREVSAGTSTPLVDEFSVTSRDAYMVKAIKLISKPEVLRGYRRLDP